MEIKLEMADKTIVGFWAIVGYIAIMPALGCMFVAFIAGILPAIPIIVLAYIFGKEGK